MRRIASIGVLYVFWLLITASVRPFDLLVGLVVAGIAGWWADRVLWPGESEPLPVRTWVRLPLYLGYLLKEIVVAAVYVAERVLDPEMNISPAMQTHRVRFSSDTARAAFANSITLTPGTLTVDVDGDVFIIHCLHESFSDAISSGDLERRVTATFDR
ncbi:MAG: Na+/H+ antiporter subunit E [Coriobacteriia bacterium]|nr:Na+/H+ antiporter subunit E [Coriobacteriia bacterium]MBN2839457.1 Na+/H+ antiporter subunit E [Coriobacteriia bacterium]